MRKFFGAVAAVVMAASTVVAAEPVELDGVGLGGIEQISDVEGKSVRGLSASSAASGLSSLGAIFYDVTSGSKANIDLVNFSAGEESAAAPGAGVDAQNYNAIGIAGDLAAAGSALAARRRAVRTSAWPRSWCRIRPRIRSSLRSLTYRQTIPGRP